jgi:hypothetical protein
MSKKSISASNNHWNGKKITLTENTKRNIMKKAYLLDAESMTGMQGGAATATMEAQGILEDRLVETEGTLSNMAFKAIELLEANTDANARVEAIYALQRIGYTNIYESNSDDFITPPDTAPRDEEPGPAQEPESKEPAWKTNPYFNRGAKKEQAMMLSKQKGWETARALREQNRQVEQMQQMESQADTQDKAVQKSQFIQTLMPNVGRTHIAQAIRRNEVSNYAGPSPVRSPVVRPYSRPVPPQPLQQRQAPTQLQQKQSPQFLQSVDPNKEAVKKYGLNPGTVMKFNTRVGLGSGMVRPVQPNTLKPNSKPNVGKFAFGKRR